MPHARPLLFSLLLVSLASCVAGGQEARVGDAAAGQSVDDSGPLPPDAGSPDAGPPDSGPPDAGPQPDAGQPDAGQPDAGQPDAGPADAGGDGGTTASAVVEVGGCQAAADACTCTPLDGANACQHSFGGAYANLGCSGGYQCCDGTWRSGLDVCGSCLCSDPTGQEGCSAPGDATALCHPVFEATASVIPLEVQEEMTGLSYKPELACPPFSELRLLRLSHWDFDGAVSEGELVVHESAVAELTETFEALFAARFPIERMVRVDAYGADDDASMAANNTSAFNCRMTTSGTRLSEHSHGTAVDINPLRNPYVTGGGTVYPPEGASYVDRTDVRTGMIIEGGPVVVAFDSIEWGWGGRWASSKDYQHFSRSGL